MARARTPSQAVSATAGAASIARGRRCAGRSGRGRWSARCSACGAANGIPSQGWRMVKHLSFGARSNQEDAGAAGSFPAGVHFRDRCHAPQGGARAQRSPGRDPPVTSATFPVLASIRTTASRRKPSRSRSGIESDTIQNGFEASPCRRSRTAVRVGVKSTSRSARSIACSFVSRTWDCWQLRATTKASANTIRTTTTRGHVAVVRPREGEYWAAPVRPSAGTRSRCSWRTR